VALLDLLERIGVVVPVNISVPNLKISEIVPVYLRGNGNVTAVNNLSPGVERIRGEWHVVAATKSNPA
jgi:hypothetical protein